MTPDPAGRPHPATLVASLATHLRGVLDPDDPHELHRAAWLLEAEGEPIAPQRLAALAYGASPLADEVWACRLLGVDVARVVERP